MPKHLELNTMTEPPSPPNRLFAPVSGLGWRRWLAGALGLVFIASAVVNLFGWGENIPLTFVKMAEANRGTGLAGVSGLIAPHPGPVSLGVFGFMGLTGLSEFFGLGLLFWAALGQLIMMLGFVTLLHRAFPLVILTDGLLALAIAALLVRFHAEGRRP